MSLVHLTNVRLFRRIHSIVNLRSFIPQVVRFLSTDHVNSTAGSIQRAPAAARASGGKHRGRHTKNPKTETEKSAWPIVGIDAAEYEESDDVVEDVHSQSHDSGVKPERVFTGERVFDGYTGDRWKNGTRYIGFVKAKEPHGWGKMTYRTGSTYEGSWEHGRRHGNGTLTWKEVRYEKDNCYVGVWKDNVEHGHGKQMFGNGDCFEGMFADGHRCGQGKLTYADGTTLEGVFQKNAIYNGKGVAVTKGGAKLIGDFKDGVLCGPGRMVSKTGKTIIGEFVAGHASGKCTVTYPNGDIYEGDWNIGPNGQGRLTHANGKVLQGEFRRGRIMNGTGMQVSKDGVEREGRWQDGVLVQV